MGVIRAEPARVSDWGAKSMGAAWRSFDLQLTTYAGLLVAIGLVMAYTNSLEGGADDVQSRADVGGDRGRRVHRRDGLRLPLAQDPGLADLWHPARSADRDSRHRRRRRRVGALGVDRAARIPVQRDRQDPDDHRPGQLPGGPRRALGLALPDHRCLPAGRSAAAPGHAPAGPRNVARVRRDPRRDALDVRGEPALADGPRRRGRGDGPDRVDVPAARLPEGAPDRASSTRTRTSRAPASSSTRPRSPSGPAASSARA